jgi:hypothetical protein
MLTHFTSKAYLVYAKYWGAYSISVDAIAIFNTEKRAIAFKEKYTKKYTASVEIIEIAINPDQLIAGSEICKFAE